MSVNSHATSLRRNDNLCSRRKHKRPHQTGDQQNNSRTDNEELFTKSIKIGNFRTFFRLAIRLVSRFLITAIPTFRRRQLILSFVFNFAKLIIKRRLIILIAGGWHVRFSAAIQRFRSVNHVIITVNFKSRDLS